MTLDQLRVFVAVAEGLHMTQAAQRLHMTQSAASAAVAALEQRYGVRLFNRVGRGLELSQAGQVLLPEARAVLARAAVAEQALDEVAGLKRGQVRLAASQTVASHWLPARMAAFAMAHPQIGLSLTVGNTQQVVQAVLAGEVDLGIVEGLVDSPLLGRKTVGGDRLSLYAAPGHPLQRLRSLKPEQLRASPWVMRESGSGTRADLEAALAAMGLEPAQLPVLLELPSNEAVLAAVVQGGCLCAVSDLAAAPHVAAGTLRRLAFDLGERSFSAILHRDRPPSRALAALAGAW